MISKEVVGIISVILSLTATAHYVYLIAQNRVKPHMFTWIIWLIVSSVAATARTVSNAGPGAWTAWAGVFSIATICFLSFFRGERDITRSDKVFFIAALSAIPLWIATNSPLAAVILTCIIDFLGFLPTIRKSYVKPFEEPVYNYLVSLTIQTMSLCATQEYSLTTTLTPSNVIFSTLILLTVIIWRRKTTKMRLT